MKRFKLLLDIEKEEKWLNEQLQEGYRCTNISGLGVYTFEKTGERYVMRLDYQDNLSKEELDEYKGIYEDFGWNYMKGSRLSGIKYWQKEEDGRNEIFSDRQSKGNYYKRLMRYSFWLGTLSLAFAFMLYSDIDLYHQGLWGMEGRLFWVALLFETPFVMLKLAPVILAVVFANSYFKSYRKYSMLVEK
ncbi:DUF2812 domain-containing protein [Oceanobacillus kapialis]|uniref:DUF2812 domain-containing protein n=1 Tax=Oceanobacillus kapialis TaxID=481353 RepID=A0ABW5Q367_9BACI